MRLSDLEKVNGLAIERRLLQSDRSQLETSPVSVTISDAENLGMRDRAGRYADSSMSAAVRPSMSAELDRRIEANASQLASLGVDVD